MGDAHSCSVGCWTSLEVSLGQAQTLTSLLLNCPLPFTVTKLQVSKSKRTLTLVENRPIQLNCSVKSQTSPNSHFAVLWYVHKPSDADGKLILKTTHSSAFEYGTYAEEEGLRGRLQFERHVSGGLFSLTVQRAEVSDSGSYYCHVEEWLLSPNYAWYKLAEEVSGRTEVTVKLPGENGRCGRRGPVGFLQTLGLGELCTPHPHTQRAHTQTATEIPWVWLQVRGLSTLVPCRPVTGPAVVLILTSSPLSWELLQ